MTFTEFSETEYVRIKEIPHKYAKYGQELNLAIGIIKEVTRTADGETLVGVYFSNIKNIASSKGLFWFNKHEITMIEDTGEEITMNIDKYIKNNYKFCLTRKNNCGGVTEVHAYKGELKEGDFVICDNAYSNGALSVRVVMTVDCPVNGTECYTRIDGEVMGVADVTAFFERKEKEKKAAELKQKMAERAKAYQEEAFWKMMAKEDSKMAELLAEFEEVTK